MKKVEFEIKKCTDCHCHIIVHDVYEFCLQYEEEIPPLDGESKPDFCKLLKVIMEFEE